MKYKTQTIKCFDDAKIKNLYQSLCVEGGKKSFIINGEEVKAKDLEAHYGPKPKVQVNTTFKVDKDIKETKDEDMAGTQSTGHIEEPGDGTSKESE